MIGRLHRAWTRGLRDAIGALGGVAVVWAGLCSGAAVVHEGPVRFDPLHPQTSMEAELTPAQHYLSWHWTEQQLAASAAARVYWARYGRLPADYYAVAVALVGARWASCEGWWGLPSTPQGGQPLPVDLSLEECSGPGHSCPPTGG